MYPENVQHEFDCHEKLWGLARRYWEPNSIFGHGVDHALRAYKLGKIICDQGDGDFLIVGSSCYLMDIGLNLEQGRDGHKERSINIALNLLPLIPKLKPYQDIIITCISYHDADDCFPDHIPVEVNIVRDCDTLDRMGFPGIRMTLKYGEWIKRQLFHSDDPICLYRKPDLDNYTMDYIRFLFSLYNLLSTKYALEIGKYKLNELECYMKSFLSLCNNKSPMSYRSAFNIVDSLVDQNGDPYGKIYN